MAAFLETRLVRQVEAAGEDALLEAIIVVRERGETADDGGLARRVVARAADRCGETPRAARYVPRANAVVVTAGRRFLEEILRDEELFAASSVDVETLPFSEMK